MNVDTGDDARSPIQLSEIEYRDDLQKLPDHMTRKLADIVQHRDGMAAMSRQAGLRADAIVARTPGLRAGPPARSSTPRLPAMIAA